MNDFDTTTPEVAVPNTPLETAIHETAVGDLPVVEPPRVVDPVRSAAGRRGGQRVHQLAELGREYEREHGLSSGRQRLKQLIQLGKRYEVDHGLRAASPRRRTKGDAWTEFVAALARVVRPAHRPAVERLALALRPAPEAAA